MPLSTISWRSWVKGALVASLAFLVLGTASALWGNPFFVRMTTAGGWEIGLLGMLSVLLGLWVAIRRPACRARAVGMGGVLGFLGVACPVCNKVLLLVFGGELLLTYFEPLRVYVAAAGVALVGLAVIHEWQRGRGLADRPKRMRASFRWSR